MTRTAQKMKFSIKDFFSKYVTFTESILNGKLHFFAQWHCCFLVYLTQNCTQMWPHIFLNPTLWQRKGTQIYFYKASFLENCPNIILIRSTIHCRFCKSNWFLGWFFEKVEKLTIFLKAMKIEFVTSFHVFGQEYQVKQKVGPLESIVWNTLINWLSIRIGLFILWCESLKEIMMY